MLEILREKYTMSKPVVIEDEPEARTVWLRVNQQSFCIAEVEDKEEADWLRDMLAKALRTILIEMK